MWKRVWIIIVLLLTIHPGYIAAGDIGEYIRRAEKHRADGRLDDALSLMEQANREHPDNSTLISYLGLYTGMSAGNTTDFAEAGRLANLSFQLLDRAVSLDPDNPDALMNRGIIYINVPEFLGKLDKGIEDLEKTTVIFTESPNLFSAGRKASAWSLLANAYMKKGNTEEAIGAWNKIVESYPERDEAEKAKLQIEKLERKKAENEARSVEKGSPESAEIINRGRNAYLEGRLSEARELLTGAVTSYPDNFDANKFLGLTLARLAEHGYDSRISEDTDLRTNLVMESVKYLDRAVELRPEDMELRFTRGSLLIYFPFFTGKSDQGIADLEMILESTLPDSLKAEALYLLGLGYRKKGNHHWIDATVKYPESEAAGRVYREMKPEIPLAGVEEQKKPCVRIDFVLGYQDELPPQTAVWIEDTEGHYIRTLYVSGFSGHVRDKQIVLPVWAEKSGFNGIDAVTGASIDVGHHTYTWDLKDSRNRQVQGNRYVVKVEVSHWPSFKYQSVEAQIRVNGKKDRVRVEEGDFIPYLDVTYLPEQVRE